MTSKLVGLPDGIHLPTAVRNQLSADLLSDMGTYVTNAETASSTASLSADAAVVAKNAAEAAAATATAPTDTMVASLVGSTSDTQTALDVRYGMDAAVTARATISVSGISTTEVPVLTAPAVTGDGVKRFKISAMFQLMIGTVDADQFDLILKDSTLGTVLTSQRRTILFGTGWKQADGVTVVVSDVPAAGLHAYQLAAMQVGGTGTGSVFGNATAPIEIIVERIA